MKNAKKSLILASASPRRQQLLKERGVPFSVMVTNADESVKRQTTPRDFVALVSRRKAEAAVLRCRAGGKSDVVILAADTVVALGSKIFGKPQSAGDAFDMLKSLSGRWHSVFTGVTFARLCEGGTAEYSQKICETKVRFKALSDSQIREYIVTGEPFDKAGSYAIQGRGGALIEAFEGDYDNVVGLPATAVLEELKDFGVV